MAIDATVYAKVRLGVPINLRTGLKNDDGSDALLDDGVKYTVQNTGGNRIKMADRTAAQGAPNESTKATMTLDPGQDRTIELVAGATVWAWVSSGVSSLGVTEGA